MNRRRLKPIVLRCYVAAVACSFPGSCTAAVVKPELIGEGVISTIDDEFGIAFAPDGKTAYFTKRSPTTNTPPRSAICVTHLLAGRWSEPEIAGFSGRYNDFGVALSADGKRLIFTSDRPVADQASAKTTNIDLWTTRLDGELWSEPGNLGAPINTPANEAYPSLAADGTLYFSSNREGGKGAADLYRARLIDGQYAEPENLGQINSEGYESQPAIAPDQSVLVFTALGRSDILTGAGAPYSRTDLYVSFRTGNGWTSAHNIGAPINTSANESNASFSPDGKFLYFASDRNFAVLPLRKPLTTREFNAGLHGLFNGWNNVYRVSRPTIASARGQDTGGAQSR